MVAPVWLKESRHARSAMAAFCKELEEVAMDTLQRFPRAWCDTCGKVQPITLGVIPANDKNPREAADIVCVECKSIIATLHAPEAQQTGVRPGKRQRPERWRAKHWTV